MSATALTDMRALIEKVWARAPLPKISRVVEEDGVVFAYTLRGALVLFAPRPAWVAVCKKFGRLDLVPKRKKRR